MSFSMFKPLRARIPQEISRATKDSLAALDSQTVAKVQSLEKALEEVERNVVSMKFMLCGDGDLEPTMDQVTQLVLDICNDDVLTLLVHKLPILGWEARKELVLCWSIMLRHRVGSTFCCVEYIENHLDLLDFLVTCYDNKEIALNCGNMLRDCIKFSTLAKYMLESTSFELFFKFIELSNFDIASDAFTTFKDLLMRHPNVVSEFLTAHYEQFFGMYEKLLTSSNYVTRRQSLKVFVANPNKSREIKVIVSKNHERLLEILNSLSTGKGSEEDEQFEEEKELIVKEIQSLSSN